MQSSIPVQPLFTHRAELFKRLGQEQIYDIAVVGGGATGLGVALDAAARGFKVVLVESHDFSNGTSSRSTKLVHGGVRYLAQGNISLVREALRERTTLLDNAPHLVQPLSFVIPTYKWWEVPFYGIGLTIYDALAGMASLGPTRFLNRDATLSLLPKSQPQRLKAGIQYWDAQFNDARLALAIARTAAARSALLLNYCRVADLFYEGSRVAGLVCEDKLSGHSYRVYSRCVINATGVWVDELRRKDGAANQGNGRHLVKPMVAPSQGVHVVVDGEFLGGDTALLIPKTADGRVLFALPWLGKVILGTTDTPQNDLSREPLPFKHEIDLILSESARYLSRAPLRKDIRSVWVGLRPLIKAQGEDGENTKGLSREHTVLVSRSGLVTVTGGKWTTYRAMAEDVLRVCQQRSLLAASKGGVTAHLKLIGAGRPGMQVEPLCKPPGLHSYGDEQALVMDLAGANTLLTDGLSEAMVRFASRYEYAVRVEDVLARRSRLLFLDARLAGSLAARVGEILYEETGLDPQVERFIELAQQYLFLPE